MQLRWLITTNHVTADDLRRYRETTHETIAKAKSSLENRTGPVLQYLAVDGSWQDVPTIIEYRNE